MLSSEDHDQLNLLADMIIDHVQLVILFEICFIESSLMESFCFLKK